MTPTMVVTFATVAVEVLTIALAVGLAIIGNSRSRGQLDLERALAENWAQAERERLRKQLRSQARRERAFLWTIAALLSVAATVKVIAVCMLPS